MPGDLNRVIELALAYAFNESIGYSSLNDGSDHMGRDPANPDMDCSGFVGRILYEAGYDYPYYHVGTINMKPALIHAGFDIIPITSYSFEVKHGDIIVLNHLDMTGGHTRIYAENVRAFTDPNADSSNIAVIAHAAIEAQSKRDAGDYDHGDTRKNGTGAYWQVWSHAYTSLIGGYDPTDPNDEIYIARDPAGSFDAGIYGGALMFFKLFTRSSINIKRLRGLR